MENLPKKFSHRLRSLRGGKTQAEFAKQLGISNVVTYHRYEAGRIPKMEILKTLADKLQIDVNELFGMPPAQLGTLKETPQMFVGGNKDQQTKEVVELVFGKKPVEELAEAIKDILSSDSKPEIKNLVAQALTEILQSKLKK